MQCKRKKWIAITLAIVISTSTIMSSYQTANATVALFGVAEFLSSLFCSVGLLVGLEQLVSTNDYQDRLDELMKSDYQRIYDRYMASYPDLPPDPDNPDPTPKPTQAPDISPPVTVPPINPDELPMTWDELKDNATTTGLLEMGAATYWCVKEAVKGLWEDIMTFGEDSSSQVTENPYVDYELVGKITSTGNSYTLSGLQDRVNTTYLYNNPSGSVNRLEFKSHNDQDSSVPHTYYSFSSRSVSGNSASVCIFSSTLYSKSGLKTNSSTTSYYTFWNFESTIFDGSFQCYIPYTIDGVSHNPDMIPIPKNELWVNPDLKPAYDNNQSPNLPETVPPVIMLPTLDELKDLLNQGKDNPDDRPVIVENFITNHYVNPTPDITPEPTTAPQPTTVPKPTTAPQPTGGPQPSGAPEPTGIPDPDNPDNPDNPGDIDIDDTKTDLRLVFPFCIPFDLIHLIEALDAEPEAPVFKIPVDFEFMNPWTQEKIINYHEVFEVDIGKLEPVVKLFRLFQVIFFIIGLMMITRQHMIKG